MKSPHPNAPLPRPSMFEAWPVCSDVGRARRLIHTTREQIQKLGRNLAYAEVQVTLSEQSGASAHCVNCLRWEGKHWQERGRCSLLMMHTARLETCEKFQTK